MNSKNISSPYATGGGGHNFESRVQAAFVVLMLTGGFVPCLPLYSIKKIKLQGKHLGYNTDDFIAFTTNPDGTKESKFLAQIKHSVSITEGDKTFGEVIKAAWDDFNNPQVFSPDSDFISLITGPLSATDIYDVRQLLEWARNSEDAAEYFQNVSLANFSSDSKRVKLNVFRVHLRNANSGTEVSDDTFWRFMKCFHLLGYDLDFKSGVTLSLLHSLIFQFSQDNAESLWTQLIDIVQHAGQNAGTITHENISREIKSVFKKREVEKIPDKFARNVPDDTSAELFQSPQADEIAIATLLGSWDEKNENDKLVISKIANEDYAALIRKLRIALQKPGGPLSLSDGRWEVG